MAMMIILGFLSDLAAKGDKNPVNDEVIAKITKAVPEKPSAKPKKERNVLVFSLCQGFKHGCIPVADKCLEIMGEKSGAYKATFSTDMNVFTEENLKQYDVLVFNNSTNLKFENEDHRKALMNFVKSGKGIVGIHAASDNFNNFPEAAEMIGGQFDGHPWGAGGTWGVQVEDPENPINAAFEGKNFKIKDEIYQIKGPYSRDSHHVLLSLDLSDANTAETAKKGKREDRDYAISWIKSCGEGRVFYCGLGHNNEIFWNPAVARHYLDGIQWAAGDLEVKIAPHKK